MLGGLQPIIIFNFAKAIPAITTATSTIPYISQILEKIPLVPVPIYLAEELTGLYVDTQEKNVDIETTTEALGRDKALFVNQKAINSTIRVNFKAKRGTIGLTLLSAMIDQLFELVTSKEYSITYFNGAITIFDGLLHSYQVNESADTELIEIVMEITRGDGSTKGTTAPPTVKPTDGLTLTGKATKAGT